MSQLNDNNYRSLLKLLLSNERTRDVFLQLIECTDVTIFGAYSRISDFESYGLNDDIVPDYMDFKRALPAVLQKFETENAISLDDNNKEQDAVKATGTQITFGPEHIVLEILKLARSLYSFQNGARYADLELEHPQHIILNCPAGIKGLHGLTGYLSRAGATFVSTENTPGEIMEGIISVTLSQTFLDMLQALKTSREAISICH